MMSISSWKSSSLNVKSQLMRNIAFISGSRSDYGLEMPLLQAIKKTKEIKLQFYATGMHLMPKFGYTIDLIKRDFPNVGTINVKFEGDLKESTAVFAGKLLQAVVYEFKRNRPDIVIVHGDRVEMMCTSLAALYLGIPIAHIQGGDKTSTVDDSVRHAITKLANLHFPATEESAQRIRLMGEETWRIHVVGSMGIDALLEVKTLSREELFKVLDLPFSSKFLLVLYHPVSEEVEKAGEQMQNIFSAVTRFNLPVVVIYPNADPGSNAIIKKIKDHQRNPLFRVFANLDHSTFISLEKEVDCWIGNSSAGIVESASFKTPVVNVGVRQKGREKGNNVIDTGYSEDEIYQAIHKSLFDESYLKTIQSCVNPWGDVKATERILRILENTPIDSKLLTKK